MAQSFKCARLNDLIVTFHDEVNKETFKLQCISAQMMRGWKFVMI